MAGVLVALHICSQIKELTFCRSGTILHFGPPHARLRCCADATMASRCHTKNRLALVSSAKAIQQEMRANGKEMAELRQAVARLTEKLHPTPRETGRFANCVRKVTGHWAAKPVAASMLLVGPAVIASLHVAQEADELCVMRAALRREYTSGHFSVAEANASALLARVKGIRGSSSMSTLSALDCVPGISNVIYFVARVTSMVTGYDGRCHADVDLDAWVAHAEYHAGRTATALCNYDDAIGHFRRSLEHLAVVRHAPVHHSGGRLLSWIWSLGLEDASGSNNRSEAREERDMWIQAEQLRIQIRLCDVLSMMSRFDSSEHQFTSTDNRLASWLLARRKNNEGIVAMNRGKLQCALEKFEVATELSLRLVAQMLDECHDLQRSVDATEALELLSEWGPVDLLFNSKPVLRSGWRALIPALLRGHAVPVPDADAALELLCEWGPVGLMFTAKPMREPGWRDLPRVSAFEIELFERLRMLQRKTWTSRLNKIDVLCLAAMHPRSAALPLKTPVYEVMMVDRHGSAGTGEEDMADAADSRRDDWRARATSGYATPKARIGKQWTVISHKATLQLDPLRAVREELASLLTETSHWMPVAKTKRSSYWRAERRIFSGNLAPRLISRVLKAMGVLCSASKESMSQDHKDLIDEMYQELMTLLQEERSPPLRCAEYSLSAAIALCGCSMPGAEDQLRLSLQHFVDGEGNMTARDRNMAAEACELLAGISWGAAARDKLRDVARQHRQIAMWSSERTIMANSVLLNVGLRHPLSGDSSRLPRPRKATGADSTELARVWLQLEQWWPQMKDAIAESRGAVREPTENEVPSRDGAWAVSW